MPLPLILIPTALIAGGITTFRKAAMDDNKADEENTKAKAIVSETKERLEFSDSESRNSLLILGSKKIDVINDTLAPFLKLVESLKNVNLDNSIGTDKFGAFKVNKSILTKMSEIVTFVSNFSSKYSGKALNDAFTLLGAYNLHMMLGQEHGMSMELSKQDTDIDMDVEPVDSGVMTEKETWKIAGLAFLAGPGAVILKKGIDKMKASKKTLEIAHTNLAKAEEFKKEMEEYVSICNNIRRRAYSFYRLLLRLDAILPPLISEVQKTMENRGCDYFDYTPSQKKTVDFAASIASMITAIIDTSIFSEDGTVTAESEKIASDISELIEVA